MSENIVTTPAKAGINIPGDGDSTTANEQEKTFTQEQVNAIVGARLHAERSKLTEREEKLAQREFQQEARDVFLERGYSAENPVEVLGVLNAKTVDELNKALDVLEKHIPVSGKKFDAAVKAGIDNRLKQVGAQSHGSGGGSDVRKAMGLK